MKTYIMSVRPEWLAKILNGEKSIELRKHSPKPPCEVYVYCTKPKKRFSIEHMVFFSDELYKTPKGEIKYGCSVELMAYENYNQDNFMSGKVVAKFTLEKVDTLNHKYYNDPAKGIVDADVYCIPNEYANELEKKSCVPFKEMCEYGGHKDIKALHITGLVIFDEPKKLGEFHRKPFKDCKANCDELPLCSELRIAHAPQSYIEVAGE